LASSVTTLRVKLSGLLSGGNAIDCRGWGHRDPLVEYENEAFDMFENLRRELRAGTRRLDVSRTTRGGAGTMPEVGRNDPCPGGSGRKCHGHGK
jgi:preprotein translocase subunit SecA